MAAMDFPANPTNGQVYGNYVYSTATGAWNAKPLTGQKTVVSATAPATPSLGDEWFNSNDGNLYVYYTDVDGSQWVQVKSDATLSSTLGSRVDALDYGANVNYIINGAFDFWQRGTGLATATSSTTGFVSDRWQMWRAGYATGGSTYKPAGPTGFESAARVQRDAGNTSTALICLTQTIESSMSIPLAGQSVTLSFYARAGSNFSSASSILNPYIISGTGSNQNIAAGFTGYANVATGNTTLTTSWQRFSITGTVSSSATQLAVQFSYTPVGTAGTNDYFEITGVQLQQGVTATAFHRSSPTLAGELAACQRYYYRVTANAAYGTLAFGKVYNSTIAAFVIPAPVTMRTNTISLDWSGTASSYRVETGSASSITNIAIGSAVNQNMLRFDAFSSGLTSGQAIELSGNNVSSAYVGFSAEL